jgi:CBS domain-containing protein
MNPIVTTIPRETLICEVEGILVSNNISGAPLVDKSNNVVGLISKSDIVQFDSIGGDPYSAAAWEIATASLVFVYGSTPIDKAARKMLDEDVHRLIVVQDEKLLGMVSAFDFVRVVAEQGAA